MVCCVLSFYVSCLPALWFGFRNAFRDGFHNLEHAAILSVPWWSVNWWMWIKDYKYGRSCWLVSVVVGVWVKGEPTFKVFSLYDVGDSWVKCNCKYLFGRTGIKQWLLIFLFRLLITTLVPFCLLIYGYHFLMCFGCFETHQIVSSSNNNLRW